jgi:hypothetical protein
VKIELALAEAVTVGVPQAGVEVCVGRLLERLPLAGRLLAERAAGVLVELVLDVVALAAGRGRRSCQCWHWLTTSNWL